LGKGLTYDRLVVRTRIQNGYVEIRELELDGPAAWITVSGGLDLEARIYDQEVSVVPRLTRSGALLPAWTTAWPVLLGNFILEKMTGDELSLNRLFQLRYRVTGPWDEPQIARVGVFPFASTQRPRSPGNRTADTLESETTQLLDKRFGPAIAGLARTSLRGERILVGLSGGVDSAVTAMLLRDAGAVAEPVFMKNWEEDDGDDECSAAADLASAEAVCAHLGLSLRAVNFSTEYWDLVFEPFLAASSAGRTPNPDVWCNQEIKFGELFRYLSYDEIGAAAMMSRATAGVAGGTVIVSMPGSSAAVRLAMEKLILPELAHMAHIARA